MFSSISTLPAELLSSVFRCAQASVLEAPITLSQVCRRWRQVAYEDLQLWTNVPFHIGPDWVSEFIQRSSGMPLNINIDFSTEIPYAAQILEQYLMRVANLTINPDIWEEPSQLFDLLGVLSRPAPMMRHFSLIYDEEEIPLYDLPMLPTDLFGGHTLELRSILLYMVNIDWPTMHFGNLEHLEINWFYFLVGATEPPTFAPLSRLLPVYAQRPTLAQLSQLLAYNRNLHMLKLLGCLPELTTLNSPLLDVIELAYLSTLELSGWVQECVAVLAMTKFPPTCALSISCDDEDALYGAFEPLVSRVSEHLHAASCSSRIQTAEVYIDDRCLRIQLWPPSDPNEQVTDRFIYPATQPLVALEFRRADPNDGDSSNWLLFDDAILLAREVLHSLSLTTLRTMSLSFPHGQIQEQEVFDLLRPLSALECLKIAARGETELSPPLNDAPHGGDETSAQPSRLLPKLSVLELHRIQLPFDVIREAGSSVLYDMLFGYSAGPLDLRTLNLYDCKLVDDEAELLDRWLPGPARIVFFNTPDRDSS